MGTKARAAWVIGLALAGCGSVPPVPVPFPAESVRTTAVDREGAADTVLRAVLAYAQYLERLGPAELARERAGQRGNDPLGLMRQALAWGSPRAGSDPARALVALERLLRSREDPAPALQPLTRLLASEYQARLRLEDALGQAEDQRQAALERAARAEGQLEALEDIERRLARPAPRPPAREPAP